MVAPAVIGRKSAGDVTKAAHEVADAMEMGRAYARTNNTYVWVGFLEEDINQASGTEKLGIGRVVLWIAAAMDGVQGFNPDSSAGATNKLDPLRLTSVTNLIKIENIHLASFTDGTGTGMTFDTRPAAGSPFARIGGGNPPTPADFPLIYQPDSERKYTFTKVIQFNPRGESRVNSAYDVTQIVEIGLQPTHGSAVDTQSPKVVAVQLTGITGNVTIYRR